MNPRLLVILALSLASLGAALRFSGLERMVVWHDEVFSVIRVLGYSQTGVHDALFTGQVIGPDDIQRFQAPDPARNLADTWDALREHPEHGPLYYLLAWIGSQFDGGSTIVALRTTSALLGLLLFPAMAWLAREVWGRGPAPWLAIALVAVAPIHLLYAQEARQYALWSVLIAAGSAAFLRSLRLGTPAAWALYVALLVLGMYTHLLTALVAVVHAVYGVWQVRRDRLAVGGLVTRLGIVAGITLLLFLPWLEVLWEGRGAAHNFTAWMTIPARPLQLANAWATHLARPFLDIPEWPLAWLAVIPALGWIVWQQDRRATGRHLLWLLVAVPMCALVLPDVFLGGRRSLESRYLIASFLALELLVAGGLATAWQQGGRQRRVAGVLLTLMLLGGLASQLRILAADTWWTKSYSASNQAFARRINAAARPLVLASDSAVSLGEVISLSYHLAPQVRLQLEPVTGTLQIPRDGGDMFALLPSEKLRAQLQPTHEFRPFGASWQWFLVPPAGLSPDLTSADIRDVGADSDPIALAQAPSGPIPSILSVYQTNPANLDQTRTQALP